MTKSDQDEYWNSVRPEIPSPDSNAFDEGQANINLLNVFDQILSYFFLPVFALILISSKLLNKRDLPTIPALPNFITKFRRDITYLKAHNKLKSKLLCILYFSIKLLTITHYSVLWLMRRLWIEVNDSPKKQIFLFS